MRHGGRQCGGESDQLFYYRPGEFWHRRIHRVGDLTYSLGHSSIHESQVVLSGITQKCGQVAEKITKHSVCHEGVDDGANTLVSEEGAVGKTLTDTVRPTIPTFNNQLQHYRIAGTEVPAHGRIVQPSFVSDVRQSGGLNTISTNNHTRRRKEGPLPFPLMRQRPSALEPLVNHRATITHILCVVWLASSTGALDIGCENRPAAPGTWRDKKVDLAA